MKVAWLDDELSDLSALTKELQAEGVKVTTADNITEFLSKVMNERFDVLIMDKNLREVEDGEELAQTLAGRVPTKQILLFSHFVPFRKVTATQTGIWKLRKFADLGQTPNEMAKIFKQTLNDIIESSNAFEETSLTEQRFLNWEIARPIARLILSKAIAPVYAVAGILYVFGVFKISAVETLGWERFWHILLPSIPLGLALLIYYTRAPQEVRRHTSRADYVLNHLADTHEHARLKIPGAQTDEQLISPTTYGRLSDHYDVVNHTKERTYLFSFFLLVGAWTVMLGLRFGPTVLGGV